MDHHIKLRLSRLLMDKAAEGLQVEHYSVVITQMISTPANK